MSVTTWRLGAMMVLAAAILAPDAHAYRSSFTVDKCLAGKIKALGKDAAAQAGCQSKAAAKGELVSSDCVTKASAKLTGGFGKLDQKHPSCPGGTGTMNCTGDDTSAIGASGVYVGGGIADTEPGSGNYLNGTRVLYYDAPGLTAAHAATRSAWARTPLVPFAAAWP